MGEPFNAPRPTWCLCETCCGPIRSSEPATRSPVFGGRNPTWTHARSEHCPGPTAKGIDDRADR